MVSIKHNNTVLIHHRGWWWWWVDVEQEETGAMLRPVGQPMITRAM